jgi:two-component system chemotaxis response regulator CheY
MTAIEDFAFDGLPGRPSVVRPVRKVLAKKLLRGALRLGCAFEISEAFGVNDCADIESQVPIRVLVADDDADVCALLERVLAPIGLVTTVPDAESALALLASEPLYDVIVSDFMLPGIDGLEFVERVRRDERAGTVPILMISGHGAELVGERARAAGVDAFLGKPFTLAELRQTIGSLVRPHVRFARASL